MLDVLGCRAAPLTETRAADDDWYMNLVWVDGKKCLLLTHAGTLFSIFVAGVRKADLAPIGPYVVNTVVGELHSEGLPADALGRLDPDGVCLARTASRRTLGFMNDIATHCRFEIACAGGLVHADTRVLNHHLRRTLNNHGGYAYPIDRVAERLDARPQGSARAPCRPVNGGEA